MPNKSLNDYPATNSLHAISDLFLRLKVISFVLEIKINVRRLLLFDALLVIAAPIRMRNGILLF